MVENLFFKSKNIKTKPREKKLEHNNDNRHNLENDEN